MATFLNPDLQQLFLQLSKDQQETIMNMMKTFLATGEAPEVPDLKTYNRELNESFKQMKDGEVCTHEEIVELSKDWS